MEQPLQNEMGRNGLKNIIRNLMWILGGKGFAAVVSLVYLALLSRSLGVKDFGHFSLIFGTAQALVALAGFQTWQTMVRFGAGPALESNWPRLGRLAALCAVIDGAGALLGCGIAAVLFYGFGPMLELNPGYVHIGFGFTCALLWSRMTTSNGLVRVLDRVDIASYVEAVVPLGRLIAALVIVFVTGPSVASFLFAWAALDLFAAVLYWFAAWRLAPQSINRATFSRWRDAWRENNGIGAFFGITYANSSLDALYRQGPLLMVGLLLGTSAAGIYKLADQLAQGIGTLSALVARAVFPEFALSSMAGEAHAFRKLVRQVSAAAALGGIVVTLTAFLFGEAVLGLIGGADFVRGAPVLVPLAMSASFALAAVGFEPMVFSTGHANYAVLARSVSVITIVGGIFLFAVYGPVGVGWAVALGMAVFYLVMGGMAFIAMREVMAKGVRL